MPAASMAVLQATRLPLQSESDQLENEEPDARTCDLAGNASHPLSQADSDFQDRQGRAASGSRRFAPFS